MKKYKLTKETKEIDGHTLYRIECVKAFSDIKVGDKGGWIEREDNLSQYEDAWVYGSALVYGNARVYNNAKVYSYAQVYEGAQVYGNARILGEAKIYGNCWIFENARVLGYAKIYGNCWVYGDAFIGDAACVYNNAKVYGNTWVRDNAKIYGNADVHGNARVFGDATIKDNADYIVFKNNWSSGRYFTYTRSNKMWKVGCFYGTGEELIKKAYADYETKGKYYKAYVRFVEELERIREDNI